MGEDLVFFKKEAKQLVHPLYIALVVTLKSLGKYAKFYERIIHGCLEIDETITPP